MLLKISSFIIEERVLLNALNISLAPGDKHRYVTYTNNGMKFATRHTKELDFVNIYFFGAFMQTYITGQKYWDPF